MAATNFVNQSTVVEAAWLNDVNDFLYEATVPAGSLYPGAANKIVYSTAAGTIAWSTTLPASVVAAIDHGALTGLADDDHTQYHTDARALTWLGTRSTTDLAEGTNLYYTDERVDDRVGTLIQNGTGITWSYSDVGNTLTPTVTITQYTDELAQDAVGSMVDSTLTYTDVTPLLSRAALTGDVAASAGSNTTTLATVNANVGSFGSSSAVGTFTVNGKGLITAASDAAISIASTAISDFTEAAQDAVGAMVGTSIVYADAGATLQRAALTGDVTASQDSNSTTIANDAVTYAKMQNFSATDMLLGRSSVGAGDPEEIPCTAAARSVLDDATVAAMVDTLGGASSTGTGGLARATSPTFVTPILGTPTSGTLTNCTGLPMTTGVTGVLPVANGGTNASSASITAFNNITGYTAAGATGTTSTNLVFSTSPTLVTPVLGTPASGTLTNCTGLPVAGGGTGVATTTAYSPVFTGTTSTGAWQVALGPGTDGDVLTSTGAGSLPAWEAPGAAASTVVLISQQTASASATIDWTSIDAASYDHYVITGNNIIPQTDNTNLYFRVSISAGFRSSAGDYSYETFRWSSTGTAVDGSTSATQILVNSAGETLGTNTNETYSFVLYFFDAAQTSNRKRAVWSGGGRMSTASYIGNQSAGNFIGANTAVDGFRFLMSSGNITSGTFALYGVKNT